MLSISLAFAAGAAIINIWLALRCGRVRTDEKILHGDGGSSLLGRRMRAHANFVEFTPIVLILFVLVEMHFGSSIWLWGVAAAYLIGRLAHGIGMDADAAGAPRAAGVIISMLVTLGLAGAAIYAVYDMSAASTTQPEACTRV